MPTDATGQCHLYLPGHNAHWVMWARYRDDPMWPVEVLSVEGHTVTFVREGAVYVWRHHDPDRLRARTRRPDVVVGVVERCCTLVASNGHMATWFYCARGEFTPCRQVTEVPRAGSCRT